MHVVATAGHVDHGKSTLVRALTGMEPDRWAEERRRGMTIDLGFAWTALPSGETVAFVDVPGHQRFIGNMLAGVGPVPAVMFVVAADEGWARQSTEHLAALDALGVRHGLLVVTRSDLEDPELATAEALEYLQDSTLGRLPAVAVSGATGAGLDDLRTALDRLVAALPAPPVTDRLRLWVDRAFSIRGSGTVVTGTLGAGSLAVGDELVLAPGDRVVRVRGLESLKRRVERVDAVARVAVNLRGVDLDEVRRGHALLTPGAWATTTVVDVRLSGLERSSGLDRLSGLDGRSGLDARELPATLVLHLGSAAVPVHSRPLGPETARLRLAAPLPLQVGDRAILRDPGQQRVAAGVVVLDPAPPVLRRRGDAARRGERLADLTDRPDAGAEVARRGAVRRSQLVAIGALGPHDASPPDAVVAGDWLVAPGTWQAWSAALLRGVDAHAGANPMKPGLPRATACAELRLPDPRLLDALVDATDGVVLDRDGVHRTSVGVSFPPAVERALADVERALAEQPFGAPEAGDLQRLGLGDGHLAAAVRAGRLARVADGVYLRPDAYDGAVRRLATLSQPFTLSEARQALGTTRRVAVPLLEQLDLQRRTQRLDAHHRQVVG